MLFIYIIVAYLFIVWILVRLIVPHLGFQKELIPTSLPEDFKQVIEKLNIEAKDDLDFLKKSYDYVTSHYYGSRMKTVTNFWIAFEEPINHVQGFLPCTSQNYLIRLMLIKSGRFQEQDIEVKIIPLNLFIHQYLRVKVGNTFIDVDPWSHFLGVPFGKKSAFFG